MKKRILSILLAALMVMTVFTIIPTTVSAAATKTTPYTYQFKDLDARNVAEGQVFDLAAFGEAETEPNVSDGIISDGEYTVSGKYYYEQGALTGEPSVDVSFAAKGKYLYFSFTAPSSQVGKDQVAIQYDIGIGNNHKSYKAWDRLNATVSAAGAVTGNAGCFLGSPTLAGYLSTETEDSGYNHNFNNGLYGSGKKIAQNNLIVASGFNKAAGTYEIKIDLQYYYSFFHTSCEGQDVYDHPIVSLAFWYGVGTDYQTHYCFKNPGTQKIDSLRGVNWVPGTIIIPDSSLFAVKNAIGDVGRDFRNAFPDQMAVLTDYATTLPTIDGKATDSDKYQVTHLIDTSKNATSAVGNITAKYSMGADGYLYAAFSYVLPSTMTSAPTQWLVQGGLAFNNSMSVYSRSNSTIKATTSTSSIGKPATIPDDLLDTSAGAWGDTLSWGEFSPNGPISGFIAYDEATKIASCEVKVHIASCAEFLELGGWDSEASNCFQFLLWPAGNQTVGGSNDQVKYNNIPASVKATEATKYTASYGNVTVKLPDGCVEKFKVDNVADFEAYGQDHVKAGPSTVTLDGKIGASEYTGYNEWTQNDLRTGDGVMIPDYTATLSGKNYFAYDSEYFYWAAEVKDPNYVSGKSKFQFNFMVVNKDKAYSLSDGVTRINLAVTMTDAGPTWGNFGGIYRGYDALKYTEEEGGINRLPANSGVSWNSAPAHFTSGHSGKTAEVAGSVDNVASGTDTIIYELRIPLATLKETFGVDHIDQIAFVHFIYSVKPGESSASTPLYMYKIADTNLEKVSYVKSAATNGHKVYTRPNGNKYELPYANNFLGHVVELCKDYQTKGGASVRMSSSIDQSGLRFQTVYNTEYLNQMKAIAEAYGKTFEVGTLIAPASYVEAAGAFTHEALAKKYATNPYAEVKATVSAPFSTGNGTTTYAGSIVGIKDKTRDFAGIGYIKIGDTYYYSSTYCVRNVADIATAALADTSAIRTDDYKFEVSAGVFSPYSEGQRLALNSLKSN